MAHPDEVDAPDGESFARISSELNERTIRAVRPWLVRAVEGLAPGLSRDPAVGAAIDTVVEQLAPRLRDSLCADVDEGAPNPLATIRGALTPLTDALAAHGLAPVPRDAFARDRFPHDRYGLAPAAFADIDPALHEPAITWGAARAHVHLRRRARG